MHIRDITSILAYPTYSDSTVVYSDYAPAASMMPSITPTVLTAEVTVTSFVTMTSAAGYSTPSIFELIETLPSCSVRLPFRMSDLKHHTRST